MLLIIITTKAVQPKGEIILNNSEMFQVSIIDTL